jgi:serine/threonine protein kinase
MDPGVRARRFGTGLEKSNRTMEDRGAHGGARREGLYESSTLVDHFSVLRLVGKGGMGEVYLARDTRLGRKVALKVINARLIGSEQAFQRFLAEARITAKFNHPHIVTIHAVGEFAKSDRGCASRYASGWPLPKL